MKRACLKTGRTGENPMPKNSYRTIQNERVWLGQIANGRMEVGVGGGGGGTVETEGMAKTEEIRRQKSVRMKVEREKDIQ
jgi:hypothetical protein